MQGQLYNIFLKKQSIWKTIFFAFSCFYCMRFFCCLFANVLAQATDKQKTQKMAKHVKMCLPLFVTLFLLARGWWIMQIKSKIYNNTLYVLLSGELDEHTAFYTRTKLDSLFEGRDFKQIIIDLSELDFMDSTGIGVLIGRYKKMKEKGISIFICNPSTHAEKIFKMTGLYDIMPKIS